MSIAAVQDDGGIDLPSEHQKPVKSFLRPGFTAINNALWDSKILDNLLGSELRLLLVIMRYTDGFLRATCIIGEEKLIRHTGLGRSALYEAKKSLEAKGHIIIHRTHAACAYQLGEALQVLAKEGEKVARPSRKSSQVHSAGRPRSAAVDPCKEPKENLKQQQLAAPAEPVQPATTTVDESGMSNHQGNERSRLVTQLKEQGVHARVALRLVQAQEPRVIAKALARLPKVETQNPAGYLVAEISRGGYQEPDKTKPIRAIHDEIRNLRQAERDREAQERERSSEKVSQAVDQFSQLPTPTQQQLLQQVRQQAEKENFTKIPGWSESHPAFRGLLAELLAQCPERVLIE